LRLVVHWARARVRRFGRSVAGDSRNRPRDDARCGFGEPNSVVSPRRSAFTLSAPTDCGHLPDHQIPITQAAPPGAPIPRVLPWRLPDVGPSACGCLWFISGLVRAGDPGGGTGRYHSDNESFGRRISGWSEHELVGIGLDKKRNLLCLSARMCCQALCGRAYATTSEFRSPSGTAHPVRLPNETIVKRTA
jgi:hypothetical protein